MTSNREAWQWQFAIATPRVLETNGPRWRANAISVV